MDREKLYKKIREEYSQNNTEDIMYDIDEYTANELYSYALWLFINYSGGGACGGSVAHDNAVKSIEEYKKHKTLCQ